MKNIFNIMEEYINLCSEIEENEGELTPELEERLSINQNEFESKVSAYRALILNLNKNVDLIDDEIDRLKKLKSSKVNTISKLKSVILQAMLLFGNDGKSGNKSYDFGTFKIHTVNRKEVKIENEKDFNNEEYLSFKIGDKFTSFEIDYLIDKFDLQKVESIIEKQMLLKDLENGASIEGVQLVINPYIVIK